MKRAQKISKTKKGINPTHWALGFFIKYPQPGRVKPKLAKAVGPEKASEVYRTLSAQSIEAARPEHQEYERVVFYDPEWDIAQYRRWLGKKIKFLPQEGNSLGQKLGKALEKLLRNYERVILMSPDKSSLTREYIREAFEALENSDVVLGPTQEGGFYLMGFKKLYPEIFENVLWNTPYVFDTLFKVLTGMDVDPHLLPVLSEE